MLVAQNAFNLASDELTACVWDTATPAREHLTFSRCLLRTVTISISDRPLAYFTVISAVAVINK